MAINKTGRSTRQTAITRDKRDLYMRYFLLFGRLTEWDCVCLQISTPKHFGESQPGNLLWCSGRYLLTDSLKRRHVAHKSGAGVGSGGAARRGSARPRCRAGAARRSARSAGSLICTERRQQALSGSVAVAPSLSLYLPTAELLSNTRASKLRYIIPLLDYWCRALFPQLNRFFSTFFTFYLRFPNFTLFGQE